MIYLVTSHRKPFSSMLVFVFLWAPRLAKVCQNSWAVNDSNVQSSISKIRTTIDFCTIDVAVLTMLPSWSWLENSRRRVGHVSDFKCNGYDVLPWYSNYIPTFVEVPQQLLFQQTKFCTFHLGNHFYPVGFPTPYTPHGHDTCSAQPWVSVRESWPQKSGLRKDLTTDQLRWLSHLEKIDWFQRWK